MLSDTIDAVGRNIDALAYIALILMLAIVAFRADHHYTKERDRSEQLAADHTKSERRVRSLILVIRFQQALIDAKMPADTGDTVLETSEEVEGVGVDTLISRLGYCLTCHKLCAPQHFISTNHVQLEDNPLDTDSGRH